MFYVILKIISTYFLIVCSLISSNHTAIEITANSMEWKKEEIAEKGIHPLHIPWQPRGTAQRKMETARQKAPGQPKDQRRPTKQTCPSNFPFRPQGGCRRTKQPRRGQARHGEKTTCPHGSPRRRDHPKRPPTLVKKLAGVTQFYFLFS